MEFKCLKCGCEKYYVRTAILPEKETGLGTYYLKICTECGYTEMYSAKILNKDKKKEKDNNLEPKIESNS